MFIVGLVQVGCCTCISSGIAWYTLLNYCGTKCIAKLVRFSYVNCFPKSSLELLLNFWKGCRISKTFFSIPPFPSWVYILLSFSPTFSIFLTFCVSDLVHLFIKYYMCPNHHKLTSLNFSSMGVTSIINLFIAYPDIFAFPHSVELFTDLGTLQLNRWVLLDVDPQLVQVFYGSFLWFKYLFAQHISPIIRFCFSQIFVLTSALILCRMRR